MHEILVTTFREPRTDLDKDGNAGERLSSVVSTAKAGSIAPASTLRGSYLRTGAGQPGDIVELLSGVAVKDNAEDFKKIRRHVEQRASRRKGKHWQAFHAAPHLLPE